jgi:hypothetical protein
MSSSDDPDKVLDKIAHIGNPPYKCRSEGPHSGECGAAGADRCICGCDAYEAYCPAQINYHNALNEHRKHDQSIRELYSAGVIDLDEFKERIGWPGT